MKKAILEVSFGTTCKEARERSILALERTFAEEFPEYTVFRAFTSGMIISSLKRQGISIDSVSEALSRLRAEGFDEVIVQSTHIIPGEEYDKVAEQTERCGEVQCTEKRSASAWLTGGYRTGMPHNSGGISRRDRRTYGSRY